jgi:hypothetical protein
MDEFQGAAYMIEVEPLLRPVGHIWPWVVAALGVLIVVVGAVLFSPDAGADAVSSGPSPTWFG